jgi:hypothetical protein
MLREGYATTCSFETNVLVELNLCSLKGGLKGKRWIWTKEEASTTLTVSMYFDPSCLGFSLPFDFNSLFGEEMGLYH